MKLRDFFRGRGEKSHGPTDPIFEVVDEGEGDKEQEPVFQEVEEDRTEKLALKVLNAKSRVDDELRKREDGEGKPFAVEVALERLAKVEYEQAVENEELGRGKKGAVEHALARWQGATDTLRASEMDRETRARIEVERQAERGDEVDIGAYTARQIRGQRRKRGVELDTQN